MRNTLWWIADALVVAGVLACIGCGDGKGIQMQIQDSNGVWSRPTMVSEADLLDIRRQAVGYPGETHDNGNALAWDCSFGNNWYYDTPSSLEVTLRKGYNLTEDCVNVSCINGAGGCSINLPDLDWPDGGGTLNDSVRSHQARSSWWTSLGVTFTASINGSNAGAATPYSPSRYVLPAANGNHPWFSGAVWKECVPWVWDASMIILLHGATSDTGDKTGPPPGSGPC